MNVVVKRSYVSKLSETPKGNREDEGRCESRFLGMRLVLVGSLERRVCSTKRSGGRGGKALRFSLLLVGGRFIEFCSAGPIFIIYNYLRCILT